MKFVTLNKIQLKAFIESDEFRTMPYLPISLNRALSHINNPRAEENDVLLILAYTEVGMAGYLGVIPDLIFDGNKSERMGWMSCMWIHPAERGKGVAKALCKKCIELWNNKLFITEFAPSSYNLFQRSGWYEYMTQKTGIRIYRRSCLFTILPARKPSLSFFKPFFKATDVVVNLFHDLFLGKAHRFSSQYAVEFPLLPDESCYFLMENYLQNELIRKQKPEIEWFLKYPWVNETPYQTMEGNRYFFTTEARKFNIIPIKVKQGIELVAFLIVTIREKHMKTPFVYIKQGHEKAVLETLNNLMHEHKIDYLTTYQKPITNTFKNSFPYLYSKVIIRKYLKSKGFPVSVNENSIQDGEGDCGFT